ncbi:NUDIX hydrolase [Nonomuraea typhae]|uniref:NUDIX hydrolase n=1 Tax=Nonomuraea typhae TaxID=2603600 RepID=UPI001FE98FCA|nr:NUDIX domain-containing protein [Nonomuraea typhae]
MGAIIFDDVGRLLLIQRGHPPGEGLWSLPGGRINPDESDHDALKREISEETGLLITPGPLAGIVERPAPGGAVFEIRDYLATVAGGGLTPGDDAKDARWCTAADLTRLPLTDGLLAALRSWNALPR